MPTGRAVTISDVEFFLVEIGCEGRRRPVRSLLVRLATDAGLEGWGEAHVKWRCSELAARRELLLPTLGGRSVFDVEELLMLEALKTAPLRAAVEMACWDLVGKATGQPLCCLFGGSFRSRVPMAVRLFGDSVDQTAGLARELADQGFHSQIVPVRGSLGEDLDLMCALEEAGRDRIEFQVDAAGLYDVDSARELCFGLEQTSHLQFILDPLGPGQLDQIASLRRQTSVPLAVRRSVQHLSDVMTLLRCQAAQYLVVDLERVGGMARARQCAWVAHAGDIPSSLGGGPWLGPGLVAVLQLAASTPAFSRCNECARPALEDDLLAEPLEIADGMVSVPQGPGLGIEVDRAKVEQYQMP